MSSVKQIVEDAIKNNKVVVFSKSYCPYCKKAKALLDSHNVQYHVIELDQVSNGAEIQDYLQEYSGQRTVPNIFINQKHIGGSDDLAKADLKALLA